MSAKYHYNKFNSNPTLYNEGIEVSYFDKFLHEIYFD